MMKDPVSLSSGFFSHNSPPSLQMSPGSPYITLWELGLRKMAQENADTWVTAVAVIKFLVSDPGPLPAVTFLTSLRISL